MVITQEYVEKRLADKELKYTLEFRYLRERITELEKEVRRLGEKTNDESI